MNFEIDDIISLRECIKTDDITSFKKIFNKDLLQEYHVFPNFDSNQDLLESERKSLAKVLVDYQAEYMLKYLLFNGFKLSKSDIRYSQEIKKDLIKRVKIKYIFELILGRKGYVLSNEDYSNLPRIVYIWNRKQAFFDYNLDTINPKENIEIFRDLKGYFRVKDEIKDDHIYKKMIFCTNEFQIIEKNEKILNHLYNQYLLVEDQNFLLNLFKDEGDDGLKIIKLLNQKFTSTFIPKNKETFWNGIKSIIYESEVLHKTGDLIIRRNFIMKILFSQNQESLEFHLKNLKENLPFHPNILSPLKIIELFGLRKEENELYKFKDFPLKTSEDFSFLILLYPKCDQSLRDYLAMNQLQQDDSKELQKRVKISLGIMEGISCLNENRISHRDLVIDNIMLLNDIPKLIDFEDSLFFKSESSPEKLKLDYIDPRFLKGPRYSILPHEIKEEKFSKNETKVLDYEKVDMYGFGYVLQELFDPKVFHNSTPIGCLTYHLLKEFDKRPCVKTSLKILKYIESTKPISISFNNSLMQSDDGKIPEIIQFIMRRIIEIQEKNDLNSGLFIESSSINELNYCTLLINSEQSELIKDSLILINLFKRIINNKPIVPREIMGELFKNLENDDLFIKTLVNMDLNNRVLLYEFLLFIFKIRKDIHLTDNKSLSRNLNFIFGYPRDNNNSLNSDIDQIVIVKKILDLNIQIMMKLKDDPNDDNSEITE